MREKEKAAGKRIRWHLLGPRLLIAIPWTFACIGVLFYVDAYGLFFHFAIPLFFATKALYVLINKYLPPYY